MIKHFTRKNAAATLEYIMLIVIILGAAIVSRDFISRAIFGKWKSSMDSLSSGRQYDPQKTLECAFDPPTGIWYDIKCAEAITCAPTDTPCLFDRVNQCSPKCIDNERPPICSRRTQCDRTPPPECGEVPDNCEGPPLQCGDCPNSGDRCNPNSHRCECNPKTTCEPGDCGDGVQNPCGGTITCPDLCPQSGKVCFNNACCTLPTCQPGQCGDIPNAGCGVTLHCGNTCSSSQVCFNNACCLLPTCQSGQCGDIPNAGCGVTLHCGDPCTSLGLSCNTATHQCECILKTCSAEQCGVVSDGCLGTLDCKDPCPPLGKVCFDHQCCQPAACDGQCEEIDAGCGVTLQCPSCPASQRCITEFNRKRCCTPLRCTPGRCGVSGDNCQGTLDCGFPCTPQQVCSVHNIQLGIIGNQCCNPESRAVFCSRLGIECGPASGTDNKCGQNHTETECGPCVGPEVCSIGVPAMGITGQQCCAPDSDADFCSQAGIQCGEASGIDNCGHPRTVAECGPCPSPQVCSIADADSSQQIIGQQCCNPESDADFCSRSGIQCGQAQGTDNCGWPKTVPECGPCVTPEVCSIPDQQCCVPVPESDAEMCSRLGIQCGQTSGTDNCGHPRPIDCGSCSEDSSN